MADHCVTKLLSHGGDVYNSRTTGAQKYGITVKNGGISDGEANLEIKFKNDWDKSLESVSFSPGYRKKYTDPGGAEWTVSIGTMVGEGTWAKVSVSVCYFGEIKGKINKVEYPDVAKSGDRVATYSDVCNIGSLMGYFEIRFYEGTVLIKSTPRWIQQPDSCVEASVEHLIMPDRDFVVTAKLYLHGTDTLYDEKTFMIQLESEIMDPVIASIGTKETPKICEPVQFESVVNFNDENGPGTRKAWWEYSRDDKEWDTECADELDWVQFSDASWPLYTFIEEHADIRHIRHTVENKYGKRACAIIDNFHFEDANGFVITVDPALNGKPLIVWHVVKVPHSGIVVPDPDLYFAAFAWVQGTWNSADSDKVYKVQVGDIRRTANPAFDEMSLGTLFDGQLRNGFDCVILARESPSSMRFGYFKKEDVFKLSSETPTCVNLKTASNDVLTEAIMGPVCDLFKIPRGTECESFWAEFYDPVFIANYVSIMKTGKDTLGNSRELTAFDHLALPFAVLGSLPVLSAIPFGAFISKGLGGLAKTGIKLGDAAVQFTLDFAMDAAHEISSKDTWYFLDAMGQVTEDHAAEIVNALTAGDTSLAGTLLRKYAGESKGWWDYHVLNDMLRDAMPTDAYEWLYRQMILPEIGAGMVINTAKQTTLSADDIAKMASAASDVKVMAAATDAMYHSIQNLDTATAAKVLSLKNALKNSPELSAKLISKYKSLLDNVASGGSITQAEIITILNHADRIDTASIADMIIALDDPTLVVKNLTDGTYNQAFGNFIDTTLKYFDVVKAQTGTTKAGSWIRSTVGLARKALDSADPARMADIPHSIFDGIDNAAPLIDDLPDTSAADEIISITEELAEDATTSWKDRGLDYVDRMMAALFRKAKGAPKDTVHYADSATRYAKWKSIYNNLEDWQKFTFWTMVVWGTYETATFFGGFVVPKILGIFPGQASGRQLGHNDNIEAARWQCKAAWDYKDAEKLEAAIGVLETTINNAEDHLNANEKEFKLNKVYAGFAKAIEVAKLGLDDYKEKLATLTPLGTIRCTSNQTGFHVFVDDESKGHSFTNTMMVIDGVKAGSHKVKIEKGSGYTPTHCEETVTVTKGGTVTVDCQMSKIEECAEITNVKIYIDPLSPLKGDTVAINGSADSYDTIKEDGWTWDFGDGSDKETGQAVTHKYSKSGTYTVKLTVTNECGVSADSTRVITVKEEEPKPESTTLTIGTPVGTDGKEIERYWDIEIWVDGKITKCDPPHTFTFATDAFCDCKAPWNLVECELGTHTITLKKAGYGDLSKSFSLREDSPEWWKSPRMVKLAEIGFINCKTTPTDADIFIDGIYYGKTDKKIEILPGNSWVIFKLDGYEDCDAPVTVAKGETVTAECVMVATKLYDVDITVPDGATLFVDGKEIKTTQVSRLSTILRDIRR